MRPRIISFLNEYFQINFGQYLVPTSLTLYLAAALTVALIFKHRVDRKTLSESRFWGLSIITVSGALMGARLYYLIQHFGTILNEPKTVITCAGGTASWGAYLGGSIAFLLYCYFKKLPVLTYLDIFFASMGLGPCLGRWGCLMTGCCFGNPTNIIWSIKYPKYSPAYYYQIEQKWIQASSDYSLPVHPVQIYESLFALILFFLASRFWLKYRNQPGYTVIFYWTIYSTARFVIEIFRGDVNRYGGLSLTLSQINCIIILLSVAVILGIIYIRRYKFHNYQVHSK